MHKYDFDKKIERSDTGSIKWDLVDKLYNGKDLIPMWVADMDFEAPAPVIDAIVKRARQGVYGYTTAMPGYYDAIINWFKKRHNWKIKKEWIVLTPGIVPAINMLIQTFTNPGDKVLIQKPVYYPFMRAINKNKRVIQNNPLQLKNGKYHIDLKDLHEKAKDPDTKIMILCSPHNPVGRVWSKDDLVRLGEICLKNNVLVIADEIHCDLVLNGFTHTPFASISSEFTENSITCTAPSKTFNLAGLNTSNLIIPDLEKSMQFSETLQRNGINTPNVFGPIALEAAYTRGEEWLAQVLEYIEDNLRYMTKFIEDKLPVINVIEPEATYLVWLDFRQLNIAREQLEELLCNKAKVALDYGHVFGVEEGEGFARINIACPRATLKEGLEKIEKAVNSI